MTGDGAQRAHNEDATSGAPRPMPAHPARQSLDGETIFAVGEDGDKWSEDEDGDAEDERASMGRKKQGAD